MTVPDAVVFDAEPLVAHADDEPGSRTVEGYLDAVAVDQSAGYVSYVNLAEVRYTLARKYDQAAADEYLDWIEDLGIEPLSVDDVWKRAADRILTSNPTLGDSFALATADRLGATLLIGGDDDYDEITDVAIERFREGSA